MTAAVLAHRARPTPTPPPTPTPIPAGTPGYARYQGQASRFDNPPGVRYQVIYPTDGWRLQMRRTEAQLINATIPGCVLYLGESRIEHAGPPVSDSVRLGDLTWSRLTLPVEGEIRYRAQVVDHVYRFQIDVPKNDDRQARQACQAAAEAAIATFRLSESATPRPDRSTP